MSEEAKFIRDYIKSARIYLDLARIYLAKIETDPNTRKILSKMDGDLFALESYFTEFIEIDENKND